jgi:hypothetical protein
MHDAEQKRAHRKRYILHPEEGLCMMLARLSTVGRWREMEELLCSSAGACCELFYFTISVVRILATLTRLVPPQCFHTYLSIIFVGLRLSK